MNSQQQIGKKFKILTILNIGKKIKPLELFISPEELSLGSTNLRSNLVIPGDIKDVVVTQRPWILKAVD